MTEPRLRGQVVYRHLVKGTLATRLAQPTEGGLTHQWRVFVAGPGGIDISPWVAKVVFHLHASFLEPDRTLTKPPYEVVEYGWGEFEIGATVWFADNLEPPAKLSMQLHLFKFGAAKSEVSMDPVYNESYETLTFKDPTQSFFTLLRRFPEPPELPQIREWAPAAELGEDAVVARLSEAEKAVKERLKDTLGEYKRVKAFSERLKHEIAALEKKEGRPFEAGDFRTFKV